MPKTTTRPNPPFSRGAASTRVHVDQHLRIPDFPPVDSIGKSAVRKKFGPNELIAPRRKPGQRKWTPAQRHAAAMRARKTRPWLHSSGPITPQGKARASQNARKHGYDAVLTWYLREQSRFIRAVNRWLPCYAAAIRLGQPEPVFTFTPLPCPHGLTKNAKTPCNPWAAPAITTPTINLAGATALRTGFISERRKSCPSTKPCSSHGRT